MNRVVKVPVPEASKLLASFKQVTFSDAYEVTLVNPAITAEEATLAIFGHSPAWVGALMKARGVFAKAVGLKHSDMRSGEQQRGIFKVQQRHANEIIIGEDDSHLNFRISVLRAGDANGNGTPTITVSTAVETHNALGRAYMFVVKPFHRVIARTMVQRAANAGRL
jgi:Protein of unknown function (DUF2867)